jgi:hypothetical protein
MTSTKCHIVFVDGVIPALAFGDIPMHVGAREKARFRLNRVENIDCHYVAEGEVCAKSTFEEILDALQGELTKLAHEDLEYLREVYIEIFGEPPGLLDELEDYYESANVGIRFEVTEGPDSLFNIDLDYCLRSGKFRVDGVSIEVEKQALNRCKTLYGDVELATSHLW